MSQETPGKASGNRVGRPHPSQKACNLPIPPPITGASIITSSRGAHFRGLAFTSCTQSPNHFLSVWVSRPSGPAKGSFQPCWGVIPISLSLTPSLVQSVWHWVKAQGESVRWTSASFYLPMSFLSPKKGKALAYKTGSQSLIPA